MRPTMVVTFFIFFFVHCLMCLSWCQTSVLNLSSSTALTLLMVVATLPLPVLIEETLESSLYPSISSSMPCGDHSSGSTNVGGCPTMYHNTEWMTVLIISRHKSVAQLSTGQHQRSSSHAFTQAVQLLSGLFLRPCFRRRGD